MPGEIVSAKSKGFACQLKAETAELLIKAAEEKETTPAKWIRDLVEKALKRRYREPADACPVCGTLCSTCAMKDTEPVVAANFKTNFDAEKFKRAWEQGGRSSGILPGTLIRKWSLEWQDILVMGPVAGRARFEELRAGRDVPAEFAKWSNEERVMWLEATWPLE